MRQPCALTWTAVCQKHDHYSFTGNWSSGAEVGCQKNTIIPQGLMRQTPNLTIAACREAIKGQSRDLCLQGSSGKCRLSSLPVWVCRTKVASLYSLSIYALMLFPKPCIPCDRELFTLKPHSIHSTHTEKLAIGSEQWPNVSSLWLSGNPDKCVNISIK